MFNCQSFYEPKCTNQARKSVVDVSWHDKSDRFQILAQKITSIQFSKRRIVRMIGGYMRCIYVEYQKLEIFHCQVANDIKFETTRNPIIFKA